MNLLSIIVGWALGLLSTVFARWMSTLVQRRKVASLLLQEVERNEGRMKLIMHLSNSLNDAGQIVEEGEVLVDFKEERGKDRVAEDVKPNTTVFSSTLNDQGLLSATTLSSVHDYYRQVKGVQIALDSLTKEPVNPADQRPQKIKRAGTHGEKALRMTEEVTEKLNGERIYNPLRYLWS